MADDLDLEEELLQVAGRSRAPAAKKRGRGKRAADSDDASSEEASSEDDGRGRGKKKQSQGSKRQRGGKGVSEDEEEDDVDEDGYGSDLYGDDEDREKLEAMTELEREMLLADRAEERDRIRQRREILKKARDADKAEPRGQRLSSRQKKSTSDKDSAIRKIEAARKRQDKGSKASKAKGKKSYDDDDGSEDGEEEYVESDAEGSEEEEGAVGSEEEEEDERPARKPTTRATAEAAERDDAGRDRDQAGRRHDEGDAEDHLRGVRRQAYDAEDDMDVDEGRGGHAEGHMDDDENADPNELRAIQLTRTQLEAMCDKPFFEGEGLTGALVRMAYGAATVTKDGRSVPTYWMMQIVSIKEGSTSYPFGPRQAPCFKRLELRDGARTVRVMPMSNASNQPLEDGECERFARHAGRVQDRPISKQQAADIKQKIQNAINYRWDSVKVKEMLARKREGGALPVNITAEKSRVQRLLEGEQGKAVVDVDKVAELEVRLKELDEALKKVAGEKRSGMSNINQRNKDANFSQTIRNVSNRPANSIGRKAGTSDPFSRRETRPNIYWNTTAKKDADGDAEGKASAAAATKLASATSMDVPLKASMARLDPTELVKMLDFDIDTKPLQDCSIVPPLHMRLLGPRWHQSLAHHVNLDLSGRTLLTVQDWQQRTGG